MNTPTLYNVGAFIYNVNITVTSLRGIMFNKNKRMKRIGIEKLAELLKNNKIKMPAHDLPDMFSFSAEKTLKQHIDNVDQFEKIEKGFDSMQEDFNDLDTKIDALMEYLKIEMVTETVVDGSDWASSPKTFMRNKTK
jgi:hypothetical protein